MPAIKKKWIKANQGGSNDADIAENNGDIHVRDELSGEDTPGKANPSKPKKRHIDPSQGGMMRGLDGEVLLEKRKRFLPPAESKLNDWLDSNLEKRNDVTLSLTHLYKYYTELCQGDASDILDVPVFNRMIKDKFGKSFGIKVSSMYKTVLKERKLDAVKKKANGGFKLKEIAHEAIKHFGNPWTGVRFFSLKQYVGTKYPFIQIDQRPKLLKRTLEMGVNYGQIDLVKGIGMAGFYRLPGAAPPKPKEKSEKEGKAKSKEDSKNKDEEADSAGSDAQEPKGKEDAAETGEKTNKEEQTDKPKSAKPMKKCNLKSVRHGNPQKIEDTFPLAITFQSAPKTASVIRIRRYIQEQYKETVQENRWRKAIEGGAEKGQWEYISGSGITGRLHLLMDDFDPDSEHLEDMVCAAIIACHEPKAASGNQIKKYISRYHPEFHVDEKPDRFKKALIRAAGRSMIVQVSGLGANGSFQLADTFVPSPRVLSGEDASSDEDDDISDEEPAYIPKGTKSRSLQKTKTVKSVAAVKTPRPAPKRTTPVAKKAKNPPKPGKKQTSQKRVSKSSNRGKRDQSSEEEEEEEEEEVPEYTPRKTQSRGGSAKTPSPQKKDKTSKKKSKSSRGAKNSSTPIENYEDADDDEEDGDDEADHSPEYTPRKSQSRGKVQESSSTKDNRKSISDKPEHKAGTNSSKSGNNKSTLQLNESDGEDEDSEPEYTPRKSSSRGGESRDHSVKEKKGKKKGRKRF